MVESPTCRCVNGNFWQLSDRNPSESLRAELRLPGLRETGTAKICQRSGLRVILPFELPLSLSF